MEIQSRFPIFLSSTNDEETKKYRIRAREIIESDEFNRLWYVKDIDAMRAKGHPPLEECRQQVEKSSVYVGLFGPFYGSVNKEKDISYTEYEYRVAVESSLEIGIFLLSDYILKIASSEYVKLQGFLYSRQDALKNDARASHVCTILQNHDLDEFERLFREYLRGLQLPSIGLSSSTFPEKEYKVDDLDEELLERYLESKQSMLEISKSTLEYASREIQLIQLGILDEDLRPEYGALLCFGKREKIRKIQAIKVHFVVYDANDVGSARSIYKEEHYHNLIRLYQDIMQFFRLNSGLKRIGIAGTDDRDALEIPEIVLREAVVNALIHREFHDEYEHKQPTRIEVYPDRVEIISFGGLVEGITETQLNDYESGERIIPRRRNPLINQIFMFMQIAELGGGGVERIHKEMRKYQVVPKIIEAESSKQGRSVRVIIPRPAIRALENWHELLMSQEIALRVDSPDYEAVLRALDRVPDGLPGDLNDRFTALEGHARRQQAAERSRASEDAWRVIRNPYLNLAEKASQLGAIMQPRLGEFDPELEDWYRGLLDPNWNDIKRDTYLQYLENHIKTDAKNDYLWLKDQRDLLGSISSRSPELEDLRQQILDQIADLLRRENRIQSVYQTGSYMAAISELTLKIYNGEIGYEIEPESGLPRFDADGNQVTYDPAIRRNQIETEYASWAIRNGIEQFRMATGLLIEDWLDGDHRLRSGRDLQLIESDLRKGIIGFYPQRRDQSGYEIVGKHITTNEVIPPNIAALRTTEERKRFLTVMEVLDEALQVLEQVLEYAPSNSLSDLYQFVLPYYDHPALQYELERLEYREYQYINTALEDIRETSAEIRDEAAVADVEQILQHSPFNLRFAPSNRRDYIEKQLNELMILKREMLDAKKGFQSIQYILNATEQALNVPEIAVAENHLALLESQINDGTAHLNERQNERFSALQGKLVRLRGFSHVHQETRQRYKVALQNFDSLSAWDAALKFAENSYSVADSTSQNPYYFDGRKMYLHALARCSYLAALQRPYKSPKNSRQEKLDIAKKAMYELENLLAYLAETLDDYEILEQAIAADEEEIRRHLSE